MASLAEVTREVRIVLKLAIAALVVGAVFVIFFRGGTFIKNIFLPSPPLPPEEKFGKLPRVQFPSQTSPNLEYRINTLTGTLPTFPDVCKLYKGAAFCQMKVYKIKRSEPSLVALQNARNSVAALGYTENETKISETVYQWSERNGDQIQVNILTNHSRILSNFLTEPPPQQLSGSAAKKDGAFKEAIDLLSELGQDISDLDQDKSQVTYLKFLDGELVAADRQSDAQFLRLDMFQKNIDNDYGIYYPGVTQSAMYFIFRTDGGIPRIVDASFSHLIPDLNTVSTYPIKTSQEAFEDLEEGNAYVFTNNNKSSLIDITEVTLGYYVGEANQQYLLPIIIFQGKNFTAYVQAIPDTSIGN